MSRTFLWMWTGQLVSLLGSGVTRFALGVWVYQLTGSVTQFALISVFASLPGLLVSPFAGALVDRWDRRRVLLGADSGAAVFTVALAVLFWQQSLELWHIYVFATLVSLLETFQWPAYTASTTLLVPKKHFGRVSGMITFGRATASTIAPATAGFVITLVGLAGVLWIDFATFLFAATTLFLIRIPQPPAHDEAVDTSSLWSEARFGWSFIRERPGLMGLLIYLAMLNLITAFVMVLVVPMVLAFASERVLGMVLAAGNAGLVAGSAAMTLHGGPKRRVRGLRNAGLLSSFALLLVGLDPSALLIGLALFLMMFGFPVINGCSQAIWQSKVPPGVQGRVFAVRRMIAQFTGPIGYALAGPLADRLFEPLMAEGGALVPVFGQILGVGPGRGIGLAFLCLAVLSVVGTMVICARPRVLNVEDELPDAVDDQPPVAPTGAVRA